MAFTNSWDETAPSGAAAAASIDDVIRALKLDLRERLSTFFYNWSTDATTDKGHKMAKLSHTGSQVHPALYNDKLNFDTVVFDRGGFGGTANQLTIPEDGYYQINAHGYFATGAAAGSGGNLALVLDLDPTTKYGRYNFQAAASTNYTWQIDQLLFLPAATIVQVYLDNQTGDAITMQGQAHQFSLSIMKV